MQIICNVKKHNRFRAVTLIEVLLAVAIIAMVFVLMVQQFRNIRRSWTVKRASAEVLQNGLVLDEHMTRNLMQARRILTVSEANETNGFIEFLDNDGNTLMYSVAADDYVRFGHPNSMADLAGPVNTLQFICYDTFDLNTPVQDPNAVRFIEIFATVRDSTGIANEMSLSTCAYLRINDNSGGDVNSLELGDSYYVGMGAEYFALCRMDETHHLFAYDVYHARILTVNPDTGLVSPEPIYTAGDRRNWPALCRIDDTHCLRAYEFGVSQGGASVLTMNPTTWTLTEGPHHEYDGKGTYPALSRIDDTHYLCVYTSTGGDGWAVVLTVNPADWSVTHETPFEYDGAAAELAGLIRIDDSHHLCVYRGNFNKGTAVILKVDTTTWTITAGTPLLLEKFHWWRVPLAQIDATHFLCPYFSILNYINAVVFTVDTSTLSVTASAPFEVKGPLHEKSDGEALDAENYVCVYLNQSGNEGYVVPLQVDGASYEISKGEELVLSSSVFSACLSRINDTHMLCVYRSATSTDVYGVVITGAGDQVRP